MFNIDQLIMDLLNLDYPLLQIQYAIIFASDDLDDAIYFANEATYSASTKCSLGVGLYTYLVCTDRPNAIGYKVESILEEKYPFYILSVISAADHVFCLIKIEEQWYLVHSYLDEFTLRHQPIDLCDFVADLQKLEEKFDPDLWLKMFGAPTDDTKVRFRVEATSDVDLNQYQDKIKHLQEELAKELADEDSYIYSRYYNCLL